MDLPRGVQRIDRYPFRLENIVVDVMGRPNNWRKFAEKPDLLDAVTDRAHNLGIREICNPKPVHKSEITSKSELRVVSESRSKIRVFTGLDADGSMLEPGEGYALSSGDCPTVVVADSAGQMVTAVHFNRANGIDSSKSILEVALGHFPIGVRRRMIAIVSLGVCAEHFTHPWDHENPEMARRNKERTLMLEKRYGRCAIGRHREEGGINLRQVALEQLLALGICRDSVYMDDICTFESECFWSHRQWQDENSQGEHVRNLVLVGHLPV